MSKAKAVDKLEAAFDAGKDMEKYFDFGNPAFPNHELKRVNVDFPQWMVAGLDAAALRLGISPTAPLLSRVESENAGLRPAVPARNPHRATPQLVPKQRRRARH